MADSLYTSDRLCKVITQNFRAEGNLKQRLRELDNRRKKSIVRIIMKTMEIERDIGPLLLPRVATGKSNDGDGVQRQVTEGRASKDIGTTQRHVSEGRKFKNGQLQRQGSEGGQVNGELKRQVSEGGQMNNGRSQRHVGEGRQVSEGRLQRHVSESGQVNDGRVKRHVIGDRQVGHGRFHRHDTEGEHANGARMQRYFSESEQANVDQQLSVNGRVQIKMWERRRLNGTAANGREISSRPRSVYNRPYVPSPEERREINDRSFRELIHKYKARKETAVVFRPASDYPRQSRTKSFRMPKITQSTAQEQKVTSGCQDENIRPAYKRSGSEIIEETWQIGAIRRKNAIVFTPVTVAPHKVKCAEWLESNAKKSSAVELRATYG